MVARKMAWLAAVTCRFCIRRQRCARAGKISRSSDQLYRAVGTRRRRRSVGAHRRQDHVGRSRRLAAGAQCAGRHRTDRHHQASELAGRRLYARGADRRHLFAAGRTASGLHRGSGHSARHHDPAAVRLLGQHPEQMAHLARPGGDGKAADAQGRRCSASAAPTTSPPLISTNRASSSSRSLMPSRSCATPRFSAAMPTCSMSRPATCAAISTAARSGR